MRILLTGATGFIGSYVARTLIERGDEVYGIALPGAPRRRLVGIESEMQLIEGDLADASWTHSTVAAMAPDAAIHTAWFAEPGTYLRAVPENLDSLRAGINLIDALVGEGTCRRIVLAGTCLENMETPGPTIYAAAKRAQHELALGLAGRGVSAACAHIHYLYGPWEDERRVVPTVIRTLLAGNHVDVGSGAKTRDYLHVADVAAALCRVAESDLVGRVDICTGAPVTLRQVFDEIGRSTGRPELLRIGALPEPESGGWPATGDPTALLTTGWIPQYDLRQGITETTAWWSKSERMGQ